MNLEIKPIGIIGAMDNEIELLKSSMEIRKMEAIAGMTYYCGMLCGQEVVLVRCGIGKVNAAICAQLLSTHFGVGRIINTGVAGSLNKDINIGDIVVSTDAVQHDMDCTSLGYAKGIIPDNEFSFFQADENMRRSAVESVKIAAPGKTSLRGVWPRATVLSRILPTNRQLSRNSAPSAVRWRVPPSDRSVPRTGFPL